MREKQGFSGYQSVNSAYQNLIENGAIEEDPAQLALVAKLDQRMEALSRKRLSRKSSSLGWLFGKANHSSGKIQGLYIWGDVGRGKSMLMDLFHERVLNQSKRRCHFNDFMQDVQERIHARRKDFNKRLNREADPIPPIGKALADQANILCFDEFTVTDIADAMILGRLFKELFDAGVFVVATSNVAPWDLYRNGLNRKLFLPFIDLLLENVEVFQLDARTDFRFEKLEKVKIFHYPLNDAAATALQCVWESLTGAPNGVPDSLLLKGREFVIPEYVVGVARIGFNTLCAQARSAEDYLALARHIHTLIIPDIRQISPENRNMAKRFILLIDTLYDNHVRLIAGCEVPIEKIYANGLGTEAFEIKRTVSRLNEMRSNAYLEGV